MTKKIAAVSLVFDFPYRLTEFSVLNVGQEKSYIDYEETNAQFRVYMKEQGKEILQDLIAVCGQKETPIGVYFSSAYLDLLAQHASSILNELVQCAKDEKLQLIGGTANNSLSALYSLQQFELEIKEHQAHLTAVFGSNSSVFYNAENCYTNEWDDVLVNHGYTLTMTGAIEWYLGGGYDSRIFQSKSNKKFKIALIDKNQSDALSKNTDQAHHIFQWNGKMLQSGGGLSQLLALVEGSANIVAMTELYNKVESKHVYNIKTPIIGSIEGRSLNSFHGNAMQSQAIKRYYALSESISKLSPEVQKEYMILGCAFHFLQMATPFESQDKQPYEYYNHYMNMCSDLEVRK